MLDFKCETWYVNIVSAVGFSIAILEAANAGIRS